MVFPRRPPGLASAVLATLAIGALPRGGAHAQARPARVEYITARVQESYHDTKTFQAGFKQVYKPKAHSQTRSSGRVSFENPGKMAWTYEAPSGNRVVSDGQTVRVYEKGSNQMFESPVGKSQYPAALSFLMGDQDLSRMFNLQLLDSATMKFATGYVLAAIPKAPTPAYQKGCCSTSTARRSTCDASSSSMRRATGTSSPSTLRR